MVKFVANNNNSTSIKVFLFFALRGLHLCMSFDIINFLDTIACKQINQEKSINISESIHLI